MDSTTSTAPWWYVAALAGGFTILGALAGLLSSYLGDRRKFAREDARKYDDVVRGYAASLISALVDVREQLKRTKILSGLADTAPVTAEIENLRTAIDGRLRAARLTLDELSIVGSEAVRNSARSFYRYVHELQKDAVSADLKNQQFWVNLRKLVSTVRAQVGAKPIPEDPSESWLGPSARLRD